jgi:serine/threonine protein kinase
MAMTKAGERPDERAEGVLRAGDRVGRFEVECRLGRGSTGTVYRARDPLIDRKVALKTLDDDWSVPTDELRRLRRRFLNEARSAGAIDHPGIVTIYDVIEDPNGQVTIAMEHVEGQSLRDVLNDPSPLPLDWIGRTVSVIAEILDEAHRRGIVHRDIKPANILLATDGQVKIADFGIASLRGDDFVSELNSLGTPNFLSPERILGRPADHRADVWALGVVLYEMLTRRLPFHGETIGELVRNIVQEPCTDPLLLRPDLPVPMIDILARALEKEPDIRYQRAGDLAEDLREILERQQRLNDTVPSAALGDLDLLQMETSGASGGPPRIVRERKASVSGEKGRRSGVIRDQRSTGSLRSSRSPKVRKRASRRVAKVLVFAAITLLSLGASVQVLRDRAAARARSDIEAQQRTEVTDLLEEGEQLLARGEIQPALRVLERAATIQPEDPGIAELRTEAERQWRRRLVAERQAEAEALYTDAMRAFDEGDYGETDRALASLFLVDDRHPGGRALESALVALRLALERPTPSPDDVTEVNVEGETGEEPGEEPEESPGVAEALEVLPVAAWADPMATVGIDFVSERPKGVLTLYAGEDQLLLRRFRFFERRGLFRRGVAGAFESERRVAAGPVQLRVYLALPGRETQVWTVDGLLHAGEHHTLGIRVDEDGSLDVLLR